VLHHDLEYGGGSVGAFGGSDPRLAGLGRIGLAYAERPAVSELGGEIVQ
jgi:hypothetical protein